MGRATPLGGRRAGPRAANARKTKSAKSPKPATMAKLLRPTVRSKRVITPFHIALRKQIGKSSVGMSSCSSGGDPEATPRRVEANRRIGEWANGRMGEWAIGRVALEARRASFSHLLSAICYLLLAIGYWLLAIGYSRSAIRAALILNALGPETSPRRCWRTA